MDYVIKRFPWVTIKPIPSCEETHQFFLLPGLIIGKSHFTLFWGRMMLAVNFNTTLIKEGE